MTIKQEGMTSRYGLFEYYRQEAERLKADELAHPQTITRGDFLRELDSRGGFFFRRF